MKRKLPPLSAVRAFEAAARLRSFKHAAGELDVTATAISHQVRQLEEWCGVRLFERRTRQIALTPEAAALYPVLREGLDAIADAFARVRVRNARTVVTLSATVAFTAKWLVPRVAAFRAQNSALDLRLHAADDPVDLRGGVADVAIRYGEGPYPGLICEPLFEDRFAPVCSPRLGVKKPEDLRSQALLHTEWRHPTAATPTWRAWCAKAGVDDVDVDAGTRFNDESHAIQAAISGQGVALLSLVLLTDELESGVLVQPFGPVLQGHRFNLVYPEDVADSAAVVAVRRWLESERRN